MPTKFVLVIKTQTDTCVILSDIELELREIVNDTSIQTSSPNQHASHLV